jgi:hypothetical protein
VLAICTFLAAAYDDGVLELVHHDAHTSLKPHNVWISCQSLRKVPP